MTTYTFNGPHTTSKHKGTCPQCGKKVTRSRTFEKTVNPFNRHPTEDRPKTWDEVRADVNAEADAWKPDFTCQDCEDSEAVEHASADDLFYWIGMESRARSNHHDDRRESRADLCNQRIARYERRLMALDPTRITLRTTAHHERSQRGYHQRCYHEFPDGSRCVYGELHGAQYHLSPTGDRATLGAGPVADG